MKIAVGSDHAGFELKARLLESLKKEYEVLDFGSFDKNPVDFPDIAQSICKSILSKETTRGIMFCGTGIGACIACNKISGIRAGVCHDLYSAHQSVEHDDVQVLCLGAQVIGYTAAKEIIALFLNAKFSNNEEFIRRVKKLAVMDNSF